MIAEAAALALVTPPEMPRCPHFAGFSCSRASEASAWF